MKTFLGQIFLIITYGGIIQGIFIVLLLNNKEARKGRANVFLSTLLLALSFSLSHIMFAGAVIDHLSARVYSIGDPTFYLIAPLLWFYTRELTGLRVQRSWKLLLHFLPFVLVILLSLSFQFIGSADFVRFLERHHRLVTILFWTTIVVQFSGYQILVQRRWNSYQSFIEHEVSNIENVSISWVRFFMIVFLLINLLFLFSLFAAIHLESGTWLPKTTALVFSLSIFALGYKGVLQKEIFQPGGGRISGGKTIEVSVLIKEKPDSLLLDRLKTYMDDTKPFLNPELTLTELAKGLNITRGQLSLLINEGTGDNFYDFINKYRVDQVKKLMIDPGMQNFNMLGIALEAGFKSKSTFNLIFKRFTGLTPSEYKRNIST